MDLRKQLRQIRKGQEISVRQMAEETDTSKNTIQSCDSLRMMPNLKYLIKIADYLGYELKLIKKE
jgi:DNA-binding XRE family transcriptional regulator